ncbi:MAG TPA: DUF488 family protein [Steroidobacteraceae bacterium]|nr:DUF488 family protein [Steroidobacteraceae bacterium]
MIRIVRLGTRRAAREGTRLGTVRRPPRGVAKKDFARRDWYDVWFPLLAPSAGIMKLGLASQSEPSKAAADRQWQAFARKYRAEMRAPGPSQALDALAALSAHANFSVGCYCENESRCHRSLLRALLAERGATIEP